MKDARRNGTQQCLEFVKLFIETDLTDAVNIALIRPSDWVSIQIYNAI